MNKDKIKEMLTLIAPVPSALIPIGVRGQNDDLKRILKLIGCDFLADGAKLEAIRTELDPEGKAVQLDKLTEWLDKQLVEYLDEQALFEAFDLFDADHDGKINMEEFEFFMSGFAKDMNGLRDNQIVKDMLQESSRYAGEDKLFEIKQLVSVLRRDWQ